MNRRNSGDCIGSTVVTFSGTTIESIPAMPQASSALLQFYTNGDGVTTITAAAMAYQPLVMITENGEDPVAGYAGADGFGIFHMGMYEVRGQWNLQNAKFTPFTSGYTVYCKIQYYR